MSQVLLNNLIVKKVTVEEIVNWLQSNDDEISVSPEILKSGANKADFISYFTILLREQSKSFQQAASTSKDALLASRNVNNQSPLTETANHKERKDDKNLNKSLRKEDLQRTSQHSFGSTANSTSEDAYDKLKSRVESRSAVENYLQNSSHSQALTSTPEVKDKSSASCQVINSLNKSSQRSEATKSSNERSQTTINDLIATDLSKSFNRSDLNDIVSPINKSVTEFNKTNYTNVTPKRSLRSDISDMLLNYSNSCDGGFSFSSPIASDNNCNDSSYSPARSALLNNSIKDKKRFCLNTSNGQKTPKNTSVNSKHAMCLGDFITVDKRSSKKSSSKKNNLKTALLDSDLRTDAFVVTDQSFPAVGVQENRKRRIKPTRLNVTDEKGNIENSPFGIITRPIVTNPQFVEVPTMDKSIDETSFLQERDLLREKRQEQQQTAAATASDQERQDAPVLKILTRPRPSIQLTVPKLELVQSKETLDMAINLYCNLLDHNLTSNPMTELYFVVSLVTLQYITVQNPDISLDNVITEESNDNTTLNSSEDNSLKSRDKDIKDELGCSLLHEEDDVVAKNLENQMKGLSMNASTGKSSRKSSESNDTVQEQLAFLVTPHNCVYFATNVLNNQKGCLTMLDRTTIKLLWDNNRIASFQPQLRIYLENLYTQKCSKLDKEKKNFNMSLVESNVCFQTDTDNRDQFPGLYDFQQFIKQRDLFYDILRMWEANHHRNDQGWSFSRSLGPKIRNLLALHNYSTNLYHFARLFKSQMLVSCIQIGQQQESTVDDETLELLKSLKHMDPAKLKQLQNRLVKPQSSKGPVPLPSFPGVQEFYKSFIFYAYDPMFYKHLENCFIHEILELNDAQFVADEIENTDTMVDEKTKQNFLICLTSLKLLAKMLSYLVHLPYNVEHGNLNLIVNSQIELRARIQPSIDIHFYLWKAITTGNLSLTVPWIVKYLSMMDSTSLRVPYYARVLDTLYCIYRVVSNATFTSMNHLISSQTAILLKFSIGWFFALPNFPADLYVSCQSAYVKRDLKSLCPSEEVLHWMSDKKQQFVVSSNVAKTRLDKLDIIDDELLYTCCPFLSEFRILLLSGNANFSGTTTNRHITPVTSQLKKAITGKDLQLQLEEAFFHGQPASTRKTVDFACERVASSCVKHICSVVLPITTEKKSELRHKASNKLNIQLDDNELMQNNDEALPNYENAIERQMSQELAIECQNLIRPICDSYTAKAIDGLLAVDTISDVKEMCAEITQRLVMERVNKWIKSHIINGNLFTKEGEREITSSALKKNLILENKKLYKQNGASPTDVINELRDTIQYLIENDTMFLSVDSVMSGLNNLRVCLTERDDLMPDVDKTLYSLCLDLMLYLISCRKELIVETVENKFIEIWRLMKEKYPTEESPMSRLLSPRNVMLLSQKEDTTVWPTFGRFLRKLLEENILGIDNLSDQAVTILRNEWPPLIYRYLSECIREATSSYTVTDQESAKMNNLLEWVSGFCNEIENDLNVN